MIAVKVVRPNGGHNPRAERVGLMPVLGGGLEMPDFHLYFSMGVSAKFPHSAHERSYSRTLG